MNHKEKDLKVLFECRSIFPNNSGGIEYYLYMLVNSWLHYYPNDELFLHIPPGSNNEYLDKIKGHVFFVVDPFDNKIFNLTRKYFLLGIVILLISKISIRLENALNGFRPKWIKQNDNLFDIIIYPFQREKFVHDPSKTIFIMHDFREFDFKNGNRSVISEQTKAINNAKKIVVSWPYPYNRLLQLFPKVQSKAELIPFLYDPFDIENSGKKTENFLYYPSANAKHKNHENLIKAIAILNKARNVKIKLICSGPINAKRNKILRKLIELENIQDLVFFVGFLPRREVFNLYERCLAVITSTKYEAFSGAVLEAFRFKKPVLASRIPPIEDFLNHYALTIQLFSPDDPKDIANSITNVINNYEYNEMLSINGNNALKHIGPSFTASKFRELCLQIIHED